MTTHQSQMSMSSQKTLVDLLDEDKPIAGQKFVCVSFVSPEKIVKRRSMFLFEEFLKSWDFGKSIQKFQQFLNFIIFKYKLDTEKVTSDFEEFIKTERDNLIATTIEDEYKNFLDKHEERLEATFTEQHSFQTSTRGIKVRGVFPTQEEAELRCKLLRKIDPNHDVYVGPVGLWMPWEPDAYKTGRVEYLEEELNKLMHEKVKNEEYARNEFDKRVKDAKRKAIKDNIQKAKDSGNVLTQTINKEGNLVNVGNVNAAEPSNPDEISVANIRKELFEGENIVMDTNGDHGLSQLTNIPEGYEAAVNEDNTETTTTDTEATNTRTTIATTSVTESSNNDTDN